MYYAHPLQPLIDVCQSVLEFWHNLIGDGANSWGWSIILLTITVRLVILPLTFKGVQGMQRLQQLQPEIKRIQARYKDDKQRMNQEVMAFYQREKVNPLSSCLPLVLQIPFFISLFALLRSSTFQADIASNPGFFAINDLAEKVTEPWLLGTMIVLYVGTQLIASMVTAFSADPMQRRIMLGLPFVFAIFIVNFPAGLIVYWITTNVWTIGQQLAVKKLFPKPPPRDFDAEAAAADEGKPARGKPVEAAEEKAPAAAVASPSKRSAAKDSGGNGSEAKGPPPNPRKKKKRSGRRR